MNRAALQSVLASLAVIGSSVTSSCATTGNAPAEATDVRTSLTGETANQALRAAFREAQTYAVLPMGPSGWVYYGSAELVIGTPSFCSMQTLAVGSDWPHKSKHLGLDRLAYFPIRNDGKTAQLSEVELTDRCNNQPVQTGWFRTEERELGESVFAAWVASGALHAIASGNKAYEGIGITSSADLLSSGMQTWEWSLKSFSEKSSDDISNVAVIRSGNDMQSTVTFGGGSRIGGCALDVSVVSNSALTVGGTAERKITAIKVGEIYCYSH